MPTVKTTLRTTPKTTAKTPEQALASLMRLASRAEKSSGDALRLMYRWGVEPADREKVLARLIEQGFIDDGRYAAAYVREKVRLSGWGVHKIRAALAAKGIAGSVIENATAELAEADANPGDSAGADDRLEKYLRRKKERTKTSTTYEMRTKLIRYGLSLGHDYDRVTEAVARVMGGVLTLAVLAGRLLAIPGAMMMTIAVSLAAMLVPANSQAQPPDYYRSPLDIPVRLSANFGEIRVNRFHTGVDIKTGGVIGKQLYAAADGFVSRLNVAPGGYGRAIHITHPNGTTTVYAHLDRFRPDIEDFLREERYRLTRSDVDVFIPPTRFPVKRGDPVGFAGNSGSSTGPHLHFEVRRSANQGTLNPITHGWLETESADDVAPRITRLYHIDVDTVAGVPIHSKPRAWEVRENPDGDYSLVRNTPLRSGPASLFVVQATDRRGDVTNTFGIYRVRMKVDGEETLLFEKDALLFEDQRYACASVLYDIQRKAAWGNEAIMLATRSGNALPMYKKAVNGGAVTFPTTTSVTGLPLRRTVEITVEDDSGNARTLSFAVEPDPSHTPPPRPEGRVASNRSDFVSYTRGLMASIPAGALHDPIFYTQGTVEIELRPRADSIRPLSPLWRTGDGVTPLHKAMRIAIAADIPEELRRGACLAKVSPEGVLSYAGGSWAEGAVTGSARDFGIWCVVADITPPTVRCSFADGADLSKSSSVTLTATDNFSGIASFTGSIDGEWIIFERNAAQGRYTHRFDAGRLETGRTHNFVFTVRDGAGNSTSWRGSFFK